MPKVFVTRSFSSIAPLLLAIQIMGIWIARGSKMNARSKIGGSKYLLMALSTDATPVASGHVIDFIHDKTSLVRDSNSRCVCCLPSCQTWHGGEALSRPMIASHFVTCHTRSVTHHMTLIFCDICLTLSGCCSPYCNMRLLTLQVRSHLQDLVGLWGLG